MTTEAAQQAQKEFGVDVVEFGVINDTIHAPNERTTPEEIEKLKYIFDRVIESFK